MVFKTGDASGDQNLLFDLLRILAISMVVAIHMGNSDVLNIPVLYQNYGLFGKIGSISGLGGNIGNWGVEVFIILSGCVLEYTYGKRIWDAASNFDYRLFIEKRLIRIYPAYWFSLLLALLFNTGLISAISWIDAVKTASGFYIFPALFSNTSTGDQLLNPMGWFIGLIVCLYFLYPFLSGFIKRNGLTVMILVFVLSLVVRVALLMISPHGMAFYWFPLSRLFEFTLGIYIVQEGFYLKTTHSSKTIRFLSDLSFPVFLVHSFVLYILVTTTDAYHLNIILYLVIVLALSLTVMEVESLVSRRWSIPAR
jgi:peptidoglycan/LPS O-acetylase OafA/YrhL